VLGIVPPEIHHRFAHGVAGVEADAGAVDGTGVVSSMHTSIGLAVHLDVVRLAVLSSTRVILGLSGKGLAK